MQLLMFLTSCNVTKHTIRQTRTNKAHYRTYQEVARIVSAQIDARIAHHQCPRKEKQREPTSAKQIVDEKCKAESIGGMGRGETVSAAPIVCHYMNELR